MKPQNFLIATPNGTGSVADFNVMELTVAAGDFGISALGHFRVMDGSGTTAFCAPEQLNEDLQDERTDVFGLGMATAVSV